MLWGDDPLLQNELYKTLAPYASRVIFDSIHIKNLSQFAAKFLEESRPKLRDVNWTLISDWREVVMRVLDTQDKKEALKNADRVKIIYQQESSVQARLLKAWLVEHMKVPHGIFNLMQQDCQELEGDIFALEVTTPEKDLFGFYRRGEQALVHLSSKDACDLPQTYPLVNTRRGFRFWRELLFEEPSGEYLEVLEFIRDE